MTEFELKEEHLELLKHANIRWCSTEYGAPQIEPKRPFGNSNVEDDILEILDIEPDAIIHGEKRYDDETRHDVQDIYFQLIEAMQIVLQLQTFETGLYKKKNGSWSKVD